MRRIRKFRTNRKIKLFMNIVAVCYLSFFTLSYLTSDTAAYFNSVSEREFTIEAGTWWDGSELEFIGNGNQNIKACPELEISVDLKNIGNSMSGSTDYQVYFIKNGNPKQNGKKIDEGVVGPIEANEVKEITYKADKLGTYMFKVFQRPEYEGNRGIEEWSKKVMVKCNGNKKVESEGSVDEEIVETDIEKEDSNQKVNDKDTSENTVVKEEEQDLVEEEKESSQSENEENEETINEDIEEKDTSNKDQEAIKDRESVEQNKKEEKTDEIEVEESQDQEPEEEKQEVKEDTGNEDNK